MSRQDLTDLAPLALVIAVIAAPVSCVALWDQGASTAVIAAIGILVVGVVLFIAPGG